MRPLQRSLRGRRLEFSRRSAGASFGLLLGRGDLRRPPAVPFASREQHQPASSTPHPHLPSRNRKPANPRLHHRLRRGFLSPSSSPLESASPKVTLRSVVDLRKHLLRGVGIIGEFETWTLGKLGAAPSRLLGQGRGGTFFLVAVEESSR